MPQGRELCVRRGLTHASQPLKQNAAPPQRCGNGRGGLVESETRLAALGCGAELGAPDAPPPLPRLRYECCDQSVSFPARGVPLVMRGPSLCESQMGLEPWGGGAPSPDSVLSPSGSAASETGEKAWHSGATLTGPSAARSSSRLKVPSDQRACRPLFGTGSHPCRTRLPHGDGICVYSP